MRRPPKFGPFLRDRVDEVDRGQESFVIRAKPTAYGDGLASFNNYRRMWVYLRRWRRQDHRWSIRVRRWEDDPFGPVMYEEEVPAADDVTKGIARLSRRLRETGSAGPPVEPR